ncbi:TPA: hypothetical protein HA246_02480 [Candidatus Woesearchaeota archaeon]|nr:hypothetical protein [Candidatus Woesearchaeota archaeon]
MAEAHIDDAVKAAEAAAHGAHPPDHEAPHQDSHGVEPAPAGGGDLSGLEKTTASLYYGPVGYGVSSIKAVGAYIWAASTTAYKAVAPYIGLGALGASWAFKYVFDNYVLKTKAGRAAYYGAKDIATNIGSIATNFYKTVAGTINNSISFAKSIVPDIKAAANDTHASVPAHAPAH